MTQVDWSIPFVETHFHIWELGRFRYPWLDDPGDPTKTAYLGDYRALREDWGPAHALAECPNVACKISGLGMGDHAWTIERIRPWVLEAIEAFGTERAMFGTNWPVDSLYGSYLGHGEQAAMLHGNAERLYRM